MIPLRSKKRQFVLGLSLAAALLQLGAIVPEPFCRALVRYEFIYTAAHLLCYGTMAFFISGYLKFQRRCFQWRMTDFNVLFFAFLITACFGGTTELTQTFSFIDRRPNWFDFECNLIGAAGGVLFFLFFKLAYLRFAPKPLRAGPLYSALALPV